MKNVCEPALAASAAPVRKYCGFNLELRRNRRLFVAAIAASYVWMVTFFWAAERYGNFFLTGAIAGLAVVAVAHAGLSRATRAYSYAPSLEPRGNPLTDERQAQVRDRAFVLAYQILAAACSFGAIYWLVAHDFSWPLPHRAYQVQSVFWGVLILAACLPTAVVSWGERGLDDSIAG